MYARRSANCCITPLAPTTSRQRRAIRDALAADGIAARIDALVARLLDG